MPKFLEAKLKKEYGAKSSVPYKVMNAIGAMKGNKETAKGRAMERKHKADMHQVGHDGVPTHHNMPPTHHHEHDEDGHALHTPFHGHSYYDGREDGHGSGHRRDGKGLLDGH